MNPRKTRIGFSQRIRLEWFEQTADLILAGNDKATINDGILSSVCARASTFAASVTAQHDKRMAHENTKGRQPQAR